jgi:hypothetical protein
MMGSSLEGLWHGSSEELIDAARVSGVSMLEPQLWQPMENMQQGLGQAQRSADEQVDGQGFPTWYSMYRSALSLHDASWRHLGTAQQEDELQDRFQQQLGVELRAGREQQVRYQQQVSQAARVGVALSLAGPRQLCDAWSARLAGVLDSKLRNVRASVCWGLRHA